jgi:hypothetical protein
MMPHSMMMMVRMIVPWVISIIVTRPVGIPVGSAITYTPPHRIPSAIIIGAVPGVPIPWVPMPWIVDV